MESYWTTKCMLEYSLLQTASWLQGVLLRSDLSAWAECVYYKLGLDSKECYWVAKMKASLDSCRRVSKRYASGPMVNVDTDQRRRRMRFPSASSFSRWGCAAVKDEGRLWDDFKFTLKDGLYFYCIFINLFCESSCLFITWGVECTWRS